MESLGLCGWAFFMMQDSAVFMQPTE